MVSTDVQLRGGALDGTIHHASSPFETWGLTRDTKNPEPTWELHVRSVDVTDGGIQIWDFVRTYGEADLLDWSIADPDH